MRPQATSVRGLKLLVYEALSYRGALEDRGVEADGIFAKVERQRLEPHFHHRHLRLD